MTAEVSRDERAAVYARDGGRCLGCGATSPLNVQHRQARGMGGRHGAAVGPSRAAPNLLTLCGSGTTGCHGWATMHPTSATTLGWSVPGYADAAAVPCYILDNGTRQWRNLNEDGSWSYVDLREPNLETMLAAANHLTRFVRAPHLGA